MDSLVNATPETAMSHCGPGEKRCLVKSTQFFTKGARRKEWRHEVMHCPRHAAVDHWRELALALDKLLVNYRLGTRRGIDGILDRIAKARAALAKAGEDT